MAFQIVKPEVVNIQKATWNTLKRRWYFWVFMIIALALAISATSLSTKTKDDYGVFFVAPLVLFFIYIVAVRSKIRTSFWKQFAELNGWQYQDKDTSLELGIMFRQGTGKLISHIITGKIDDRQFRIFNYEFDIGAGKYKVTYRYTVFAFKFTGLFPHLYLNKTGNGYGVSVGERIPLPAEFEKQFSLFAPKEYEIEALEVFTPDVLVKLLDNGFDHDVEFVNQEVLIFTNGQINDFETLEKEFNLAMEIEDLFDEKLDRIKFQQIGSMSSRL